MAFMPGNSDPTAVHSGKGDATPAQAKFTEMEQDLGPKILKAPTFFRRLVIWKCQLNPVSVSAGQENREDASERQRLRLKFVMNFGVSAGATQR